MNANEGGPARLTGTVTSRGDALVDLTVIGPAGQVTVPVVVDTGFSGTLVLPATVVSQLGLRRLGANAATLADGSRIALIRYEGEIMWLSRRLRVLLYAATTPVALLGARLLFAHRLTINYPARTVEIT